VHNHVLFPFLAKEATFGRLSEEERERGGCFLQKRTERQHEKKKQFKCVTQVTSRSFFSLSNAKEEET